MRVGPCVDRHDIRLQRCKGLFVCGEARTAGERLGQLPLGDPPLADANDIEAVDAGVSKGMAHAHIAETYDKHSLVGHWLLLLRLVRGDAVDPGVDDMQIVVEQH